MSDTRIRSTTASPTALEVSARPSDSVMYRGAPFVLAVGLGLVLLPLQDAKVDVPRLVAAVALLVGLFGLALALDRRPNRMPRWFTLTLPYLFLAAIGLLRASTGGTESGYGALLFLACFWVALYEPRRAQVVWVTVAMAAVLALQGLVETDFETLAPLRGALLAAVVIGFMSLAVHRKVVRLRTIEGDLRAVNESLQRSNRDLEQFAYVSSHDLQEPLRMIRSFTQLFMQRHGDGLTDEGRELLGFVTSGAERAQQLVADLLEYSRVGTSSREFEPVELDDVVERSLQVLGPAIEESRAKVTADRGMPRIVGDPAQLERLFVNVIGNAIRYHSPDRTPVIEISGSRDGDTWRMSVRDNGIGFDDAHSERIFKMFQRLHGRDEYGGTGIGLSICERIVERHGGTISASGEPGIGATFTFTLEAPL